MLRGGCMYVCMYVCNICMYGRPQNKPAAGSTLTFLHALVSSLTSSLFSHALLIQNCHTIYSTTTGRRRIFCLFFSSPLSLSALTRPSFFFLSRVSWPSSNFKAAASLTSFSTCSTSRARPRKLLALSLGLATHCFLQLFKSFAYRYPMAAVFVPPSPQTQNMSTRRPPLANVPNATNSPARSGVLPTKRSRTASTQLDIPYGQPPPKKQVVDGVEQDARSPTRTKSTANQPGDSKLFSRRANNGQPSAFERKLHAAREKDRQTVAKPVRNEKPSAETLDTIRQWQRHYRKVFPTFVFYFDSIPEDARSKCSRQVNALGAVS